MDRREFLRLTAGGAAAVQFGCAPGRPEVGPAPRPEALRHPDTEAALIDLIQDARARGVKVRVRGSAHSVPEAIYTGGDGTGGHVDLMLDQLRALRFDDQRMRVTVQAGCNLGRDPSDPSGTSTLENSLFRQLDDRGWAVPDMGGIIHQSVGGFLSTGSAGGSLQRSIYDSIVGIRLIDGTGRVHDLQRPSPDGADPDDPFFAAGISMGLLGIVTEVTFQCIPKYRVRGTERVYPLSSPALPIDLFGAGARGLETYLRDTEHARLLWWPQPEVEALQVWEGRTMAEEDYDAETGPPEAFTARPFVFLTDDDQDLARHFYELFDDLNPPDPDDDLLLPGAYALSANLFLDPEEEKRFWDDWWKALPMDNVVKDDVLPMEFTEAWIPISATRDVMVALRDHYTSHGWTATGTNACEIYAAKASPFWMSPSYRQDVLRIDLFWYARNSSDPARDYYPQFWDLLDQFEPRYHWGKHLPTQPAILRQRYPKWDDFLALRAQLDPDDVFLTDYWAEKLGIA